MKVMVIPDLHGRNFWRQAIKNNADKIVFLGDYLDPYSNEFSIPENMEGVSFYDSESLLKMLNDIISLKKSNPNKYILLCGNHTCSYIWSNFKAASRTDYKHWEEYHNFFLENLNLFNLTHVQDNVIFSHAGLTKEWVTELMKTFKRDVDSILLTAKTLEYVNLKEVSNSLIFRLGDISYHRGGDFKYGSCEWADIREHIDESEDKLIPLGEDGIYQVFGHTQLLEPLINDKWACLDCKRAFIIDTNTYEITEC